MSSQGFDGVLITPDTIAEHLQRIKDAEEYGKRFGMTPQTQAYLNTLHEQSSKYLAVMDAKIQTLQGTLTTYKETVAALGEKQRR